MLHLQWAIHHIPNETQSPVYRVIIFFNSLDSAPGCLHMNHGELLLCCRVIGAIVSPYHIIHVSKFHSSKNCWNSSKFHVLVLCDSVNFVIGRWNNMGLVFSNKYFFRWERGWAMFSNNYFCLIFLYPFAIIPIYSQKSGGYSLNR